jgi:lysozyme
MPAPACNCTAVTCGWLLMNMQYSKAGVDLTKRFESCRLTAYQDVKGVWTIGWGHTGPEVRAGLVWTQAQADDALLADTARAVQDVNTHVTVALTQGEFDALVDFAFNCGNGNLNTSTLLRLLNAGDYANAANEFVKWDHAGGKEVAGLLRRRLAEKAEFQS